MLFRHTVEWVMLFRHTVEWVMLFRQKDLRFTEIKLRDTIGNR